MEEMCREIIEQSSSGYAYHRIVADGDGVPRDYEFLDVNARFEELTGLSRSAILGKRATEVLPGLREGEFDWVAFYGAVALGGRTEEFERYSEPLGRYYRVRVFAPQRGYFVTEFRDVTGEVRFAEASKELVHCPDDGGHDAPCRIAGEMARLAGADCVLLNRFGEAATARTLAVAGEPELIDALRSGFGRSPEGAEWSLPPERAEAVRHPVVRFPSVGDFFRSLLPPERAEALDAAFPGHAVWTVRIEGQERLLGYFALWMPRAWTPRLGTRLPELYAQEVGLFLERRETEEIRKENEQRLALAMDTAEHGFWDWNLDTDEAYFSPRYFTMLGYEPGELPMTKKTFVTLMHPEDRRHVLPRIQRQVEQAEPYEEDFRLRCKDGSWKWISGRGRGYDFTDDGRPNRAVGVHVDIDSRKRTELLLQERERELREAHRIARMGRWDYFHREDRLLWTETIFEIFEIDPGRFAASYEAFFDAIHPDDRERVSRAFDEAVAEGKPYRIEHRLLMDDGRVKWVTERCSTEYDENGAPSRSVGIVQDITETKEFQEVLQKSREQQKLLLDNIKTQVWYLDGEHSYGAVNRAHAALFGRTPEEMSFADMYDLFPPDVVEVCREGNREVFATGRPVYSEEWVPDAEGRQRLLSICKSPQLGDDGKVETVVCSAEDITDRKLAEERLQSSEENFRTFFETIDDLIFVADEEGRIFFTNRAVPEKLGYSREELARMHVLDVHFPGQREEAETIFADMFAGKRDGCPLPLRARDGSALPVGTKIWFGDWDGTPCIYGISKDLSAEQEALQKFNRLFQRNPALMAVSTLPERRFTEVNDAFLEKMAYSREEIVGRTSDELGIFAEPEKQSEIADSLRQGGYVRDVELKVRTKDGRLLDGLFSGEIIESQAKEYFLTVMTDITAQKQAESRLADEVELQMLLMRISSRSINITDETGRRNINDSLEEIARFVDAHRAYIFDYDFEHGTTSNTYEWCAPEAEPQIDRLQEVSLEGIPEWVDRHRAGEAMIVPDVQELPKGRLRELLEPQGIRSLVTVPMMQGEHCVGFVGLDYVGEPRRLTQREGRMLAAFAQIVVSIQEKMAAQEELMAANRSLQEATTRAESASRAKSDFLANMSHEIRTPLNGVIGFAELLEGTALSDEQKQYVRNIVTSGHSLLGIISDILDFSKIEASKMELDEVETDLIGLLEESVDIVTYRAGEKGIELLLAVDPAMPRYATVDPVRLRQILANLLGNAVKFTEEGEVELAVAYRDAGDGRGAFAFSVRDSGIGISEENRKKLFQAFTQADTSTTRKFGGTGLGLVISNQLAEKMGGRIEVESTPGEGSRFSFTITVPCRRGEPKGDVVAGIGPVLVVDDNAVNRRILRETLARWGVQAETAADGMEALRKLDESDSYGLVVMDYHMPYMDGLETTAKIRGALGLSEKRQPVVILYSSGEDEQVRRRSRELGIRHRMLKPAKPDELYRMLLRAAGKEKPEAGTGEEPAAESGTVVATAGGGPPRILVAEDVGMNLALIRGLLERALPGVEVLTAANGREAVEQAREQTPSLILMDLQMPVMDGYSAAGAIRDGESEGEHVPIVALTAAATTEERERCFESGMDGYLSKPIHRPALTEALQRFLGGGSGEEASEGENAAEPPENASFHFDRERFRNDMTGDDDGLFRELLAVTLEEFPQKLEELRNVVAQREPEAIRTAAHTIKGAAANMCFLRMAELGRALEEDADDPEKPEAYDAAIRGEWEILEGMLREQAITKP
ncbi:MAG: PAS domain S-box protein [Synergistales bacterium]|nr:PAS domain S-box protein [Synergistales bacterium]